ncbi:MAG: hypothetical protein WB765_12805 [Acidimicrobiales bacterium]
MIAVYVRPEGLTAAQYNKARKGLDDSGASHDGRKHHSCFGEDGQLAVYEIWESEEKYEAFTKFLLPVLQEVGVNIEAGQQDIVPVVNLEQ